MKSNKPPKVTKVKCQHCDYEWNTLSKMQMITCPNCLKKTPRILTSFHNSDTTTSFLHTSDKSGVISNSGVSKDKEKKK